MLRSAWKRRRDSRVLLGFVFSVENRPQRVKILGSPHEILQELQLRGPALAEFLNHSDTEIEAANVFQAGPRLEFNGGRFAAAVVDVLEAIRHSDLSRLRSLLRANDGLLRSEDDAAAIPLLAAVAEHKPDVVRLLIGAGAPVDRSIQFALTPLHWAAALGDESISEILISAGADSERVSWFLLSAQELAHLNGRSALEALFPPAADAPVTPEATMNRMLMIP